MLSSGVPAGLGPLPGCPPPIIELEPGSRRMRTRTGSRRLRDEAKSKTAWGICEAKMAVCRSKPSPGAGGVGEVWSGTGLGALVAFVWPEALGSNGGVRGSSVLGDGLGGDE